MEPGLIGTRLASAVVTPLIRKLFVSEPLGAGLVDTPLRISSYVSFHGEKRALDEADLRKLAHKLITAALRSGERPIPADEGQAVTDALLVEVRLAGIGHADHSPLATLGRLRSLSLDGPLSSPRDRAEWLELARMPALRTLQVTGESLTTAPPGLRMPSVFQLYLLDHVPAAAFARLADLFPRLHVLNLDLDVMSEVEYDLRRLEAPPTLLQIRFPAGTAAGHVYGLPQLPDDVDVFGIASGSGAP